MNNGTLWIIATPIGNLEDISPRALRLLASVPLVAAEDTRVARRLFSALGIRNHLLSLHDHNEADAGRRVMERLRAGDDVALVSDAGTPLISDPGYRLVSAAAAAGLRVSPVPGPCALIAALSAAGMPADRFWFEGFLPARGGSRRARLRELDSVPVTLGFYESARRLPQMLADAAAVLGGGRDAVVARELTKRHETVLRGTLSDLQAGTDADPEQQLGEAVVLVAGSAHRPDAIDAGRLARELAAELPPARAAKVLTRLTSLTRKQAFDLVQGLETAGKTDSA